ncbi:hypothetical protein HanRHA438_Chr13g0602681 [Helianthus annuus]|uniref:Uncharacterized protein n=1 Tax=Helianthus annuus TaxID=4232 RepID=A0A9K3HB48_HELAN|nr:hypothetical protein HanXRQr2_Chr13g0592001 [Helianthus annuus]KAJ0477192.1 hypothetical protein HanHA300_Chr13g0485551 [Helianthus annuus]KAJ0498026.1 hypothetical protein HanHA89_Chr13g0517691 [Helianthus annuus]KAJ0858590.1 hypothetical protein HanRHA438_Chr13g0602681 [Helianthus annuus]
MLQRVNALGDENEGLMSELKTSQTIAVELKCRVVSAERELLERELCSFSSLPSSLLLFSFCLRLLVVFLVQNAGVLLEQREKAWEKERAGWVAERERLLGDVKHYKEAASVSTSDIDILYADLGIAQEDSQKLAVECHWILSEGFGRFLSTYAQSEEFKGRLERVYKAYMDVCYQAGLKYRYSFSSQGMKRKETPHYNSKANKQLAKLDEEFSGKTPTLVAKIADNPLMSLDDLKSLFDSADPASTDSPSGEGSP